MTPRARSRAIAVIALLTVVTPARPANDVPPRGIAAAVHALQKRRFSGSVVIGGFDGAASLSRSFGAGLSTASLYDIGSVAKLVTATAVLRLEEDGALSLTDSISMYVPHVPPADRQLTIRSLLLHTSGLPENFSSDLDVLSRVRAVARILALPRAAFGRFSYSNAGYVLLAAIVQAASHRPFEQFVRTRVLAPAHTDSFGFYTDANLRRMSRAHGFVHGRDRGAAGDRPLSWSILGAGGMLASAPGLYRWVAALARGSIVGRSELAQLDRAYLNLPGRRVGIAYGGVIAQSTSGRVAAVGGGTDFGFTADVRRFFGRRVITVILSNSSIATADRMGFAVAGALRL